MAHSAAARYTYFPEVKAIGNEGNEGNKFQQEGGATGRDDVIASLKQQMLDMIIRTEL